MARVQADEGFIDPAVFLQVKVIGAQECLHLNEAFGINEQAAENGLFRLGVHRYGARDGVHYVL